MSNDKRSQGENRGRQKEVWEMKKFLHFRRIHISKKDRYEYGLSG
jgi:hypothetical protein